MNRPITRFVADFGPLLVFFIIYFRNENNLKLAIPPFIVATLFALIVVYFLEKKIGQWGRDGSAFTKEAFNEYLRCLTPETIHASCEDYRASATIDIEHDQIDLDN